MSVVNQVVKEAAFKNGSYTAIPNELWTFEWVSGDAKTLWAYLLSVPENWDSSRNNLAKNLKMHRTVVSRAIKELQAAKMLIVKTAPKGSFDFALTQPSEWDGICPGRILAQDTFCPGGRTESVPHYNNILNNNIAHFAQNEQTEHVTPRWDLEAIYQRYPKKVGKARGMKKLAKLVTSQRRYDELMSAVLSYANWCAQEGKEQQFIKQFDTFLSDHWKDYVTTGVKEPVAPALEFE